MQRLLTGIAIGVVMTATVLLAVTVVAQDAGPLALGRPLLVDVRQSVPVLADVVVPLDNDTTVNATVPLTLEVALQIAVSGVISESVQVARSQPVVAVSAPPVALPSQTMLQQAQPLIYAGLQWTVRSAANVGAVYDDPQDQRAALMTENAFLVVQLAVENLGAASKEVDYDDDEFSILLRDSTGRRFAWREHPTTCAEHDLNPGLIKSCPLLFEVPRNAQGFSVIFTSENGYEQTVPLGF